MSLTNLCSTFAKDTYTFITSLQDLVGLALNSFVKVDRQQQIQQKQSPMLTRAKKFLVKVSYSLVMLNTSLHSIYSSDTCASILMSQVSSANIFRIHTFVSICKSIYYLIGLTSKKVILLKKQKSDVQQTEKKSRAPSIVRRLKELPKKLV